MKTIQQIFMDTNPKDVEKVTKGFEKGNCLQYKDAVIAEVARPTAMDFQKIGCIVTDNYYVDYSAFKFVFNKQIGVIPLDQISTLYRSNIVNCGSNQYDYEFFYLVLELKNGAKIPCNRVVRHGSDSMKAYDEIIALVKARITKEEA